MPNLHFFIVSRIDKNLGLYGEQEIEVKADILKLLRDEVQIAKDISKDIQKLEPKAFDSMKGFELLRSYYKEIGGDVNLIMAKQIAKFDEKQVKRFFEINEEKNEEIEDRIKEREADDYYRRYEFFLGDLNQKQKDLIFKNVNLFKSLSKQRLQNRLSTQSKMKDIFKNKNQAQRQNQILALFNENMSLPLSGERKKAIQLFGEIVSLMDAKQIEHFAEKRHEWIEWLDYYIKYFSSK